MNIFKHYWTHRQILPRPQWMCVVRNLGGRCLGGSY